MDKSIYLNNKLLFEYNDGSYKNILQNIIEFTKLSQAEFYLTRNGKLFTENSELYLKNGRIQLHIRVNGGKGGFGSMLRAIGAQIEKTTNKEACRDLSGRRLRDINEEKKLKAWLEKQKDREDEAKERKRRKLEKLTAIPKHEFKDSKYESQRSEMIEKVNEAVEEGFKKAQSINLSKRKAESIHTTEIKPRRFFDDDMTSGSDTDSDSNSDIDCKKIKLNNENETCAESSQSFDPSNSENESNTSSKDSDEHEQLSNKEISKEENESTKEENQQSGNSGNKLVLV